MKPAFDQSDGPRGRKAYLWLIDHTPAEFEPRFRSVATSVRQVRLRIRLFRQRWLRRGLRGARRSERAWRRRLRRLRRWARRVRRSTRTVSRHLRSFQASGRRWVRRVPPSSRSLRRARRGLAELAPTAGLRSEDEPVDLAAWSGRGRIARALFPPAVQLPGDGDLIAIDSTGWPTKDVVAARHLLPDRVLVLTDSTTVGELRSAGIPYEYLPNATSTAVAESVTERISWLDYVYGIDRIEPFGNYNSASPPETVDGHRPDPRISMSTDLPPTPTDADTTPGERTTGWRSIFSLAPVYRSAQRLIGADSFRRHLVDHILDLDEHDRVIDIGCGTADILNHLPPLDYIGFDPSQRYVDDARSRFGERGTFVTGAAAHLETVGADRTVAMAIGVLHHMDDGAVTELFELARSVLQPGGRLVTVDPALVDGQHPIARLLVSRDRGQHVRSPEHLRRLVAPVFSDIDIEVRHDLLRPPYTHAIIRASIPN